MSTTTDVRTTSSALLFATAVATLAAWFLGVAALTVLAQPTSRVIVIAPGAGQALGIVAMADGRIISSMRHGAIAEPSEQSGFVSRLYRSGAWLVLPATGGSCRGMRPNEIIKADSADAVR
jgi:hypothetical protein